MVQKITWSPGAINDFLQIIAYLEENWTEKEIQKFTDRIDEKLAVLQQHPRLGSPSQKKSNVHQTVVHKKVILIYKYKPLKKEILLLSLWNTQQDPEKMR